MKFVLLFFYINDVIIQSILCIFIMTSNEIYLRKTNHCNDYNDYLLRVVKPKFRHKVYCK